MLFSDEKNNVNLIQSHDFGSFTYEHYHALDSTMTYAKTLGARVMLDRPHVVVSDLQTKGTGRYGRPFFSPQGDSLYLTILVPNCDVVSPQIGLLTTCVAEATYEAIEAYFNIQTQIKWVNDIFLDHRKVAGILIESEQPTYLLIGIGINLHQANFPEELKSVAGNLLTYSISETQKQQFSTELVKAVLAAMVNFEDGHFLKLYKTHLALIGHQVELLVGQECISGTAIDITSTGALVVETSDGTRSFSAGEVTKVHY